MLEYAFRRGLGEKDDIDKQFAHMTSFEAYAEAIDPLMDLRADIRRYTSGKQRRNPVFTGYSKNQP